MSLFRRRRSKQKDYIIYIVEKVVKAHTQNEENLKLKTQLKKTQIAQKKNLSLLVRQNKKR